MSRDDEIISNNNIVQLFVLARRMTIESSSVMRVVKAPRTWRVCQTKEVQKVHHALLAWLTVVKGQ